jgi:hypothetical protein
MDIDETAVAPGHATKLLFSFLVLAGFAFFAFVQQADSSTEHAGASLPP